MPALTELLDKPIRDPEGDEVARLHDLVVRVPRSDDGGDGATPIVDLYPPVIGVVARLKGLRGSRDVFIPWERVKSMSVRGVRLATPAVNVQRFAKREGEIVLRGGLYDRQVVDVEGRRVVRINDLDLAERNGVWRLVAVDVSASGLMRRLGAGGLSQRVAGLLGREAGAKAPLIDWATVYPVTEAGAGEEGALRLRVPRDRLDVIRPADLARIVEQLTPQQGADLLEELEDERAADTLEELEDEQQAQILRAMDPERAADVLEEMEPDEATDALQNVTDEEAANLLRRMDREEAAEVQELLGYPEDSAGGIMTTEYISTPEWATVAEVTAALRKRSHAAEADEDDPLPETLQEVYVIAEEGAPVRPPAGRQGARTRSGPRNGRNGKRPAGLATPHGPLSLEAEGRLVGAASLRDLLLAEPEATLSEVMQPVRHTIGPLAHEREAARIIADDDLMALPVVDEEGKMLGIVTVDDAIDVVLPTAWKKRIPRLFR